MKPVSNYFQYVQKVQLLMHAQIRSKCFIKGYPSYHIFLTTGIQIEAGVVVSLTYMCEQVIGSHKHTSATIICFWKSAITTCNRVHMQIIWFHMNKHIWGGDFELLNTVQFDWPFSNDVMEAYDKY